MSIKETITHMGRTQEGYNLYLRKNKTGQWCTIRPNRKGYRWDMINYLSEYPVDVWEVTQEDLKDHLFYYEDALKGEIK